jgi:hypothetical protein
MFKHNIIAVSLFLSFALGQYDYSLEDINSTSDYYQDIVGTSFFENQVTLHYFGHYN